MDPRGALIGREAESARLQAALSDAAAGEGSLVLLAGEAGVGKTRRSRTEAAGKAREIGLLG